MNRELLESTTRALVAPGKGLLAADESLGTIGKRFKADGIESTATTRRAYRELLFTAPGAGDVLSGVITFDETLRDHASDGTPFVEVLTRQGIIPGIKVDAGAKDLALWPGEKVTEGLDGLRQRLAEYRGLGARFAKWRAVITIGAGIPSEACLATNGEALARYAALCQEADIVPIIEPEVLMDGDHTIERCEEATTAALRTTFAAVARHGVLLEGLLLKPNMVLAGKDARKAPVDEVARRTLATLRRTVPAAVPGIVFLSGGQDGDDAMAHLRAMHQMREAPPWEVSFSFARALQNEAMAVWKGEAANVGAAQAAFGARLRQAGAARRGQ